MATMPAYWRPLGFAVVPTEIDVIESGWAHSYAAARFLEGVLREDARACRLKHAAAGNVESRSFRIRIVRDESGDGLDDGQPPAWGGPVRGIVKDGALAGASAMAANVSTYVFYALVTRSLGVDSGGALLAVIAASLMLSLPVGVVGLGLSGVVSHLRAVGDFGGLSRLLRRSAALYAGGAAIVFAAAFAGARAFDDFFHLDVALVAPSAAVIVVATAGLLLSRGFLQGVGDFRGLALSNLVEAGAKIAGAATIALAAGGIAAALATFGAALLAAFAVSSVLLYVHACHDHVPAVSESALRQATPVFAAMGALTVMTFFDAIAARHFLSPREAGLYNAAALVGRALMTVLAFVPSVLLPKVRERVATAGDTRAVAAPAIAFTIAVCLTALAVCVFAPRTVVVFVGGRAYADAASLVPLYALASCSLALTSVLATIHAAHDRLRVGGSLLVVMCLEVAGVVLMHGSATAILHVIVAGHVTALIVTVALGALDAKRPGQSTRYA
jgi:O-antigen/teichoic acid export membrane protein